MNTKDSVGIVEPSSASFKDPLLLECGKELKGFEIVYETYGKLNNENSNTIPEDIKELNDETSIKINEIIEEKVRPAVARDGGDIIFNKFEDGIVYISMRGSCDGCPASTMTLKNGVENLLKHYIPEVQSVVPLQNE